MDFWDNFFEYMPMALFSLFWLVIIVSIIIRLVNSFFKKPITVKAKVIDKYTSDNTVYDFVNRRGTVKRNYYTVCFDVQGKIKKFNVSPLAYDYLKKGMSGMLTYKDNRYIDFE